MACSNTLPNTLPRLVRLSVYLFILRLSTCQIGPTFHFNVDEVDFGAVSYDCPVSASIVLTNTSDISMVWRARVPQDGTFRKRELTITPSRGTLSPGQSVDLLVELMSQTVKVLGRGLKVFLSCRTRGKGYGYG